MKKFFTQEPIVKYEVQIKSAILLVALLLFVFASRNQSNHTDGTGNYYEHSNTK